MSASPPSSSWAATTTSSASLIIILTIMGLSMSPPLLMVNAAAGELSFNGTTFARRLGEVLSFNAPLYNSFFQNTFNPSFVSGLHTDGSPFNCLVVRVTYATDPVSRLALSCASDNDNATSLAFSPITKSSVIFWPSTPQEVMGTEDPRIVQLQDGTYLLFYTAVAPNPTGGAIARLSLATSQHPTVASSWSRVGALFPDVNGFQFTKSGALLINERGLPSYLIFGDCSLYNGLQVALASPTFLNYTIVNNFLLFERRQGMFDGELVESGPPPVQLSDGNWLFLYNAAQKLDGSSNGLFYAPGYVILNGSNVLQVLRRSDKPLLMPEASWETIGQTTYVVFASGLRRVPNTGDDTFVVYYGAADTNVGAMLVRYVPFEGSSAAAGGKDGPRPPAGRVFARRL